MIFLNNNQKINGKLINQDFALIKAKDFNVTGSVDYENVSKIYFRGITEGMNLVNKRFSESMDRDNISKVIIAWDLEVKKDDRIIDDMGKIYIVKDTRYTEESQQNQFMKSNQISKLWYIGVEADE